MHSPLSAIIGRLCNACNEYFQPVMPLTHISSLLYVDSRRPLSNLTAVPQPRGVIKFRLRIFLRRIDLFDLIKLLKSICFNYCRAAHVLQYRTAIV